MFPFAMASGSRAAEKTSLGGATIVTDADQASFVQYGLEELARYLKEAVGKDIPVVASSDGKFPVQILVGSKTVEQILPDALPENKSLDEEGHVVKVVAKNGVTYVVAAATGRVEQKACRGC